jgi:hypothetical protein
MSDININAELVQELARERIRADKAEQEAQKLRSELDFVWSDCASGDCNACPSCCKVMESRIKALEAERDKAMLTLGHYSAEARQDARDAVDDLKGAFRIEKLLSERLVLAMSAALNEYKEDRKKLNV